MNNEQINKKLDYIITSINMLSKKDPNYVDPAAVLFLNKFDLDNSNVSEVYNNYLRFKKETDSYCSPMSKYGFNKLIQTQYKIVYTTRNKKSVRIFKKVFTN